VWNDKVGGDKIYVRTSFWSCLSQSLMW